MGKTSFTTKSTEDTESGHVDLGSALCADVVPYFLLEKREEKVWGTRLCFLIVK